MSGPALGALAKSEMEDRWSSALGSKETLAWYDKAGDIVGLGGVRGCRCGLTWSGSAGVVRES